jgi:hypothetical protein
MRETMRLALKSRAAKKNNSIFICIHLPSTDSTRQRVCQSKLRRSLNDKRENSARCGDALFSVTISTEARAELSARAEM